MISKELLSEVLGYPKNIPYGNEGKTYKLNIVSSPYINENGKPDDIYFQTDAPGLGVNLINIYELAHKCKEWAFDNFYLSIIVFKINDNLYKCEIADIRDSLGEWSTKHSFKIDTEPEAIFKACQWILDNKN